MKILCTGANGFIGKYLIKELGEVYKLPHQYLYNPAQLQSIVKDYNPDIIYHLASYGNMIDQKDEQAIFNANLTATWNLLQASKNIPYKALIYISTSSVTLPYQTIYSATKLGAEVLCKAFVDQYKKPIAIVRPYTVIGPGEQKEHLIPKLIDSCLNGTRMQFTPEPVHDFIDVRDVVKIIMKADKGIIEAGNGISVSNSAVKELVEEITGKTANLEWVDNLRKYDTTKWHAPYWVGGQIPLRQTIQDMVDYEKNK